MKDRPITSFFCAKVILRVVELTTYVLHVAIPSNLYSPAFHDVTENAQENVRKCNHHYTRPSVIVIETEVNWKIKVTQVIVLQSVY